jgi:hypothetical protein
MGVLRAMSRRDPQSLLYLSPVPLGSFAQRPHHFVHWFHQRFGGDVLWVDPGPSRLPRGSDWSRLVKYFQPPGPPLGPDWRDAPWLQHVLAKVLPLEPWAWGRYINRTLWRDLLRQADAFVTPATVLVLGKPCALSLALAQRYPQQRCIFDAMDHMPGFLTGVSRRWMVQAERALAEQVDAIWASSHALAEHHSDHAGKVSLVLNALTHPPSVREQSQPPAQVFGYLGVIDRWFDWDLIKALATAVPQATIELVGPVHVPAPWPLPSNVRCLPPVPQHQVYQAMQGFDVGLIPFASNDVTAYVDPVKYYEYRALGLPVLSTRFGEMSHRHASDGVYFWDQLMSGEVDIATLIAGQPTEGDRQEFCDSNNWERRFDSVAHSLN